MAHKMLDGEEESIHAVVNVKQIELKLRQYPRVVRTQERLTVCWVPET